MKDISNLLAKKNRKSMYRALLLIKKTFDSSTAELMKKALELEIDKFRRKAFVMYLMSIVRKSSIELLSHCYKLLAKASPPEEPLLVEPAKSFTDAFKEILVLQCRLIDMTFKKVEMQKWQANKKLDINSLKTEVFDYVNVIAGDALIAYGEFRTLIGLKHESSSEVEFETSFWKRLHEYEKIELWFDEKKPKGSLLWEASKNIATAMVGGPSFLLMGIVMEVVSRQTEAYETFIVSYSGLKSVEV